MDFQFIKDEKNELLNRRELSFVLTYDGATPSRREILGKICALKNVNEELVVLGSMKQGFGKQEISGMLRVYADEESRNSTELSHLIERSAVPEVKEEA